jgi:hypothetical protein
MEFEIEKEDPEWWAKYVAEDSKKHADYYRILFQDCLKDNKNPIHFIRFEDMIADKRAPIEGLFRFLLDLEDLKNTNC